MKALFPLLSLALAALPANAVPLTGSGTHLPLPATGPTSPGTWSSPAGGPWLGTFTGTGDYPWSGLRKIGLELLDLGGR